MIGIPQYIDREAWDGFCEMRVLIKKPLTVRASKMVVYELQRIKDAGHDANAALDQSTNHCWADVYVPVAKPIPVAAKAAAEKTTQYLKGREEKEMSDVETVRAIKQATLSKLRRVA